MFEFYQIHQSLIRINWNSFSLSFPKLNKIYFRKKYIKIWKKKISLYFTEKKKEINNHLPKLNNSAEFSLIKPEDGSSEMGRLHLLYNSCIT